MSLGSPVSMLRMMKEAEPRTEKLTALVTKSMMADVRALRLATMESTGDLVNRLVAQELAEHQAEIVEGRKLLTAQEARRARTVKARGPAPEAKPVPDPEPPAVDDRLVELARRLPEWAGHFDGEERSRRKRYVSRFLDWCKAEARAGKLDDVTAWSDVLEMEVSHQTVKNMRSITRRYIEWFDSQ